MLLLIKEHTDTLIEQTKTKPQETLQFKLNKQMETFSFSPSISLSEEGKGLLAVTCFEAINSVFIITDENNSFSTSRQKYWSPNGAEETFNQLKELSELRSQNYIELHAKEVEKKRYSTRNRKQWLYFSMF